MRTFDVAASQPWLIRAENLREILAITSRENVITPEAIDKIEARREALAFRRGHAPDKTRYTTKHGNVSVIDVNGPIVRYADMFSEISGGVSTQNLALDFKTAMDDPSVASVILNIDSPGGEATGIHELGESIHAARGRKPIVAYVEGYGASAAYWLASAADEIVVDRTAMLGSIGVVFAVPDPTKRTAKDIEIVSSQSPMKRLDPTTDAGKSELQRWADELGSVFVDTVARNRGVTADTVLSDFGRGALRIGTDAVAHKMADRLGSLESLITELQTTNGRARVASAQTTNNRRASMSIELPAPEAETPNADVTAQLAEATKRNEELAAMLKSEQDKRTAAEEQVKAATLDRLKASAEAQVNAWQADRRITGDAAAAVRSFYVALATGEAVTAEGFAAIIAALPQIDTSRVTADLPKQPAADADKPTRDDFAADQTGDRKAKAKIDAYVKKLAAADKSKTYVAHLKALRAEVVASVN
jgi:ClpP class serine protease